MGRLDFLAEKLVCVALELQKAEELPKLPKFPCQTELTGDGGILQEQLPTFFRWWTATPSCRTGRWSGGAMGKPKTLNRYFVMVSFKRPRALNYRHILSRDKEFVDAAAVDAAGSGKKHMSFTTVFYQKHRRE